MNFIWILAASLIGFSIASVFAGWLRLERNVFLIFYIPAGGALFAAFILSNGISVRELLIHNWYWGLAGAAIASVFVVKNVFSQPSSERHTGLALWTDIIWPGFAYGLVDSLLLSVLPVLAIRLIFAESGLNAGIIGKTGILLLAFISSIFVTVIYHLGYPEFRGRKVIWPVIGNGVLSLAFIITMNPLAAILPHIAMHIAAMIHGRETTGQVPPHYGE